MKGKYRLREQVEWKVEAGGKKEGEWRVINRWEEEEKKRKRGIEKEEEEWKWRNSWRGWGKLESGSRVIMRWAGGVKAFKFYLQIRGSRGSEPWTFYTQSEDQNPGPLAQKTSIRSLGLYLYICIYSTNTCTVSTIPKLCTIQMPWTAIYPWVCSLKYRWLICQQEEHNNFKHPYLGSILHFPLFCMTGETEAL